MRAGLFGARGFVSLTFVLAAPALATLGAQQVAAQAEPAANVNANAKSAKLTLESYFDLEDVQDPQLSPDGKQIIYTRRWVDKLNDRWESSLWIMNADGSRSRHLIDGSSAVWSPDGTRIAYLAKGEPSGTQIWVRFMDGDAAPTQITRLTESPADVEWSPDSKSLAFRMLVTQKDDGMKIAMPPAPKGAKWVEAPRIVTKLQYRRDRQGFVDRNWTAGADLMSSSVAPSSGRPSGSRTISASSCRSMGSLEVMTIWTPGQRSRISPATDPTASITHSASSSSKRRRPVASAWTMASTGSCRVSRIPRPTAIASASSPGPICARPERSA